MWGTFGSVNGKKTAKSSALGLALTAGTWLAVAACETPPSRYIPPVEPREVPNVDPPPGIPIMPSGSASAARVPDAGAPAVTGPICKSDKDCVVTTRLACCSAGDPRAALRSEVEATEKECKDQQCIDVEVKGDYASAKDFVARCVTKSCTLVKKKKKK